MTCYYFSGDAQIAARIVDGKIGAVIFLVDPLFAHPHEVCRGGKELGTCINESPSLTFKD
jgi:hypothetical protein